MLSDPPPVRSPPISKYRTVEGKISLRGGEVKEKRAQTDRTKGTL